MTCVQVKSRLEQLDDMEEGSVRETLNLNQAEYLRKIEELNRNLVNSWDNDQRVKALKIAIQVLATALTDSTMQYTDSTIQCTDSTVCSTLTVLYTMSLLSPVLQATDRYDCDPVLPEQICSHHRYTRQLWSVVFTSMSVSVCASMQCPPLCRLPGLSVC